MCTAIDSGGRVWVLKSTDRTPLEHTCVRVLKALFSARPQPWPPSWPGPLSPVLARILLSQFSKTLPTLDIQSDSSFHTPDNWSLSICNQVPHPRPWSPNPMACAQQEFCCISLARIPSPLEVSGVIFHPPVPLTCFPGDKSPLALAVFRAEPLLFPLEQQFWHLLHSLEQGLPYHFNKCQKNLFP